MNNDSTVKNGKTKRIPKNAMPEWHFRRVYRVIDGSKIRGHFIGCMTNFKDYFTLEEAEKTVNETIDKEFSPRTELNKKDRVRRLRDFIVQEVTVPCIGDEIISYL